jgi:hypothetical protein
LLLDPIAAVTQTTICKSVVGKRNQMRSATKQAASSLSNRATTW